MSSDRSDQTSALLFHFSDFIDELHRIAQIADPYIEAVTTERLERYARVLESIRAANSERQATWEIPETDPLITKPCRGGYERGSRRGEHNVFAEISCIWDITTVRMRKVSQIPTQFALTGNASTRVRLFDLTSGGNQNELAMWRMEVADSAAPGCYFHIQIMGEHNLMPYPKSLSIPRFPYFLASPAVVLEFVLSELFQDRWEERLRRSDYSVSSWNRIQRDRIERLLSWQLKIIKDTTSSPWLAYKRTYPPRDLFVVR